MLKMVQFDVIRTIEGAYKMININNLGPITNGNIELNKLSIFIGESGTGKTYASYTIYSMFEHLQKIHEQFEFFSKQNVDDLLKDHHLSINYNELQNKITTLAEDSFLKHRTEIIASTFNVPNSFFENIKINYSYSDFPNIKLNINPVLSLFVENEFIEYDDAFYKLNLTIDSNIISLKLTSLGGDPDSVSDRLLDSKKLKSMLNNWFQKLTSFTNLIYIPAERVGLHVFKDELNKSRLEEYSDLSMSLNNTPNDIKLDVATYPKPISSYLNNLNNWIFRDVRILSRKNNKKQKISTVNLLKGKFEIDRNQNIYFRENFQKSEVKFSTKKIPFQVSSSTLKSLLGFDLYIKHALKKGDYLIIDEPELNLHFKSQKEIASILYQLVKLGVHIILSTHSDYLVRELVNLELQNYIENKKDYVNSISCMYFNEKSIQILDDFKRNTFIENFDLSYTNVESNYYDLLDKIEEIEHD